eukprot:gene13611-biopygen20049
MRKGCATSATTPGNYSVCTLCTDRSRPGLLWFIFPSSTANHELMQCPTGKRLGWVGSSSWDKRRVSFACGAG